MERVAALLADRVADRVVQALLEAGFDKQFAASLLKAIKEEVERAGGGCVRRCLACNKVVDLFMPVVA